MMTYLLTRFPLSHVQTKSSLVMFQLSLRTKSPSLCHAVPVAGHHLDLDWTRGVMFTASWWHLQWWSWWHQWWYYWCWWYWPDHTCTHSWTLPPCWQCSTVMIQGRDDTDILQDRRQSVYEPSYWKFQFSCNQNNTALWLLLNWWLKKSCITFYDSLSCKCK